MEKGFAGFTLSSAGAGIIWQKRRYTFCIVYELGDV